MEKVFYKINQMRMEINTRNERVEKLIKLIGEDISTKDKLIDILIANDKKNDGYKLVLEERIDQIQDELTELVGLIDQDSVYK